MIELYNVKDIKHRYFEEAMQIYEKSFPDSEKCARSIIEKRIQENFSQLFVCCVEDEVALMATFFPLKNTEFILFDYLATHEKYRGKGIATDFIRKMKHQLLGESASSNYFILEVENPDYGDDKDIKEKRIMLYRKLGAKKIADLRYVLPPLSGGSPTEMILMILPEYKQENIEGQVLKELVVKIYEELYSRGQDDICLNTFIHDITGKYYFN